MNNLVIVVINDNRIDGQLPNDVKTKIPSFLFFFFWSLCVCKRYKTVRMFMCVVFFRFGLSFSLSLACMFSLFFFFFFFQVFFCFTFFFSLSISLVTMQLTGDLTLILNCYFISLLVIGLIYYYSLRILVYVCLSVYILHQFVTVVDRYIK